MNLTGKVFITGGAGTLGKAILRRAEGWDAEFTVYSRDPMRHKALKQQFPNVTTLVGSVTNIDALLLAMAGHDIVIHAAAFKHIVECEESPLSTLDVNVNGSQNVFAAAAELGVKHVIAISTDKAVNPANSYGASKMMMERICHAYAAAYPKTEFHLCRYGNVVGSTGSFIHNWRNDLHTLGLINSTVEEMTRFWMSEDDAVDIVLRCLEEPSGCTLIPTPKTASIGDLERWLLPEGTEVIHRGARLGEKMHESLVSPTEGERLLIADEQSFLLLPPTIQPESALNLAFSSDLPSLRMEAEEAVQLFGKVE